MFALVLAALQRHGLLKGRHLGIDSSVIEANASLRSLSERNTEEGYWGYVQRLAREAGLETTDGAKLRSFDRHRVGKKMSNAQWQNPHDPDAKIGRTKDGATDMVNLPEHTVDLDTGAIVQAQVLPGDYRDSEELSERVIEAVVSVQVAQGCTDPETVPETFTADEGYFSLEEMERLQALTLKTVISDPHQPSVASTSSAAPSARPWRGRIVRWAANMAASCCANGASMSNAALPMCSTPAGCGEPPCEDWRT